ncbi:MAG: class I SAM-dependent methyltransferase, partial [Candidatus Zophobacter franzmannii]|nr:class I SAM-dependent methyltransferase [Candidatus Zophobacter franzmannii]
RMKKVAAIDEMIEDMGLTNAKGVWSRLEEYVMHKSSVYDFIVCRSVRITPEYKPMLLQLLKPKGKIVLYKSKNLDDLEQFSNKQILDVSHPEIGTRKLIIIKK